MTLRAYAAIAFLCGGLTACLARTRAEDPLPGPQQDAAVVADAATSERRVVASAYVPVPPWEAWDWIASSDRLDQWLAQEVALDVIVGGPVRLVSDGVVTEGSISAVDEPTSMAWSLSARGGAQGACRGPPTLHATSLRSCRRAGRRRSARRRAAR